MSSGILTRRSQVRILPGASTGSSPGLDLAPVQEKGRERDASSRTPRSRCPQPCASRGDGSKEGEHRDALAEIEVLRFVDDADPLVNSHPDRPGHGPTVLSDLDAPGNL
jgi:hypothetical protein